MKTVKICYVASAEITIRFILFNVLKFLKGQGYDVSVVCSSGNWIKNIEQHGMRVKNITMKRKISPISDLIAFWQLFFYFRKEKFQIVHTHTLKPEFLAQLAAKLAGVPIIVNTIHGFDFSEQSSFLKMRAVLLLEKIAAKCSDTIFAVSKLIIKTAIKEKIGRPDSIKYWGGSVDISRFSPQRFSRDFIAQKKKHLGISPSSRVIGIVARLVVEKGYLELFMALENVLTEFPDTVLLVVGPEEPEKKDAIKSKTIRKYDIEKNAIFLGERIDVDEIYPLMDIFVLPTHREGIGASILEASAMEKPVIVSDTGGCPEAVEDKKTGILIPVKNVKKLTEAILYLFNNPEEAKKMGRNGRKKVLREFDERLVFDRVATEYQRLINKKLR